MLYILTNFFFCIFQIGKSSSRIDTCKLLTSNIIIESEIILTRTIRSFGLFFCTILFIINWFRLIIYFLPYLFRNVLQLSTNLCLFQSYFLHVLTLFHLNLTISIRLFWHYCFLFPNYWQHFTYRRLISSLVCLFLFQCFLTWPISSHKWATFTFDSILNLCIVNYKFQYSYTFFVLSFTCIIPFLVLLVSHYTQMKSIDKRLINSSLDLLKQKQRFQYSSYVILIWSLFNIVLLICIHTPFDNYQLIKSIVYYLQLFVLLFDPILYTFIFRSLSIITRLRSTNHAFL